jgi:hypothetical protein
LRNCTNKINISNIISPYYLYYNSYEKNKKNSNLDTDSL